MEQTMPWMTTFGEKINRGILSLLILLYLKLTFNTTNQGIPLEQTSKMETGVGKRNPFTMVPLISLIQVQVVVLGDHCTTL